MNAGSDPRLKFRESPNFNPRPTPIIDTLVLHYTGMKSAEAALDRLCDPAAEVSAHYVVEEDGTVWNLVPEELRAWHAGVSCWRGRRNLNDVSIGIEIVNLGHEFGYRDFPAAQMSAVTELCRAIIGRHPIPARNVVAHSDIAPMRKQDPGEKFDWQELAKNGVGLWPADDKAAHDSPDPESLRSALIKIGFDPDVRLRAVIKAFQRHWSPAAITGNPDPRTASQLLALSAMLPE